MKRLACALVLAGVSCGLASSPRDAFAAQARASGGLQLAIITPDPSSFTDRMSVDVSYRGSAVETIELYLDNALVAKRLLNTAQSRGIITFTIETAKMSEGPHDIRVAAYGADGKPAVSSARLRVPATDLSAPVRISYPLNGTPVAGVVSVRVSLDSAIQNQKPYVSFWVDKELKILRNYPPYEYTWDTTKVPNGWHVLEAWSQTDDSMTPTKARAINVNVNNASGETKKQDFVVDLNNEPASTNPSTTNSDRQVVDPKTAQTDSAGSSPSVVNGKFNSITTDKRPQQMTSKAYTAEPDKQEIAATSTPQVKPNSIAKNARVSSKQTPAMMGSAASEPTRRMAVASVQKGLLPNLAHAAELAPIASSIRATAQTSSSAVKPAEMSAKTGRSSVVGQTGHQLSTKVITTNVKPQTIATARTATPSVTNVKAVSATKPVAHKYVMPKSGAFDVAFNGYLIAFDVQPRFQDGMSIAPFRQIFEHTGGRLYWYGGSVQAVRAVNDSREIEIKIGDQNVLVNNHSVTMEKAPYIVNGRTMVPMSFLRDALDVQVRFDPATGRVLIQSNK